MLQRKKEVKRRVCERSGREEVTWKAEAVSGLWSQSTLTSFTPFWSATRAIMGPKALQGPHQLTKEKGTTKPWVIRRKKKKDERKTKGRYKKEDRHRRRKKEEREERRKRRRKRLTLRRSRQ